MRSAGGVRRITWASLLNLYVIETPAGPLLVDAAAPGMFPWLRRRLAQLSLAPRDLAGVVLTHFHVDHTGTAARFADLGVPLFALDREIPILRGEVPHPGYGGRAGRWLEELETRILGPPRLPGVQPLHSGDRLFDSDWFIVAAPGHSPGSLALWNDRRGDLISGDTLVTTLGRPRAAVPLYSADVETARRSGLDLLDLDPQRILPGHGPVVPADAFARLRRRLRQQLTNPRPAAPSARRAPDSSGHARESSGRAHRAPRRGPTGPDRP